MIDALTTSHIIESGIVIGTAVLGYILKSSHEDFRKLKEEFNSFKVTTSHELGLIQSSQAQSHEQLGKITDILMNRGIK
jgi:hypothetical protein